jgi:hypothetical protein
MFEATGLFSNVLKYDDNSYVLCFATAFLGKHERCDDGNQEGKTADFAVEALPLENDWFSK